MVREAITDLSNETKLSYQDFLKSIHSIGKEEWNRLWSSTRRIQLRVTVQNFYHPIPFFDSVFHRKTRLITDSIILRFNDNSMVLQCCYYFVCNITISTICLVLDWIKQHDGGDFIQRNLERARRLQDKWLALITRTMDDVRRSYDVGSRIDENIKHHRGFMARSV